MNRMSILIFACAIAFTSVLLEPVMNEKKKRETEQHRCEVLFVKYVPICFYCSRTRNDALMPFSSSSSSPFALLTQLHAHTGQGQQEREREK